MGTVVRAILIICLFSVVVTAQKYDWRRPAISGTAAFVGGASWGLHEKTMHHWDEFHQRFPNANPQFWNPAISWENKYRNWPEDRRLKPIPVHLSDAKHILASTNQSAMFTAGMVIMFGERRPWWHYAADIAITSACYSVGNLLTFNWLYK